MQTVTLLQHFLAMGGYAFYVWSAYFFVATILVSLFIQASIRKKRVTKSIAQRHSLSSSHECKT
jgi:heme exporter protein CcmD